MGKKIPMWQVLIVVAFMLAGLYWEVIVAGDGEGHIALIASGIVAAIVAVANGWKWKYLEKGILTTIDRSMQAALILMVVGLLVGAWVAGGVIPAMIYYGLAILSPGIFLFAGCLLCCVVSLATGSSWTTAATVGIALMGIATALDVSPAMTAGAIVSGAYFGDKMSPLSDTTNLAPAVAGSTLFEHIRHMVWTVTPSLLLALLGFLILGFVNNSGGTADLSGVTEMQTALKAEFWINPILLIPPVVVIGMVVVKAPALPGLIGGTLLGVVCMAIQGVDPKTWMATLNYGYSSSSEIQAVADLLNQGGMQNMMWAISLILCAMMFGGILDASGMLDSIATGLLKAAKGTGSLVLVTILTCIFMNVVACDQYLAIIMPGRMYKEAYEDRRLANKNLSRVLEDSGTMTSNLVPWNTCGAYMRSVLGVNQWGAGGYAPFAFLNLLNPIVSAFYGFTGISMTKLTEEQYAEILHKRALAKEAALEALKA
jgi:Na+:H+ antiporter, NhaC family